MSTYTNPRMTSPWPIERLSPRTRRRNRQVTSALAIVAAARSGTSSG